MPNDADLVRTTLDGDKSAYGDLYDRYAPLVRAICYDATHSVPCAQDLAQEVFLQGYEKLASLRDAEKFAGWLVGIARRMSSQWRRGKARDRHQFGDVDDKQMPAAEAPDGKDDDVRELHQAMQMLSGDERLAVHAFYLLDESAEDARATLGLSKSGFYRLLQRARQKLKRRLTGSASHE